MKALARSLTVGAVFVLTACPQSEMGVDADESSSVNREKWTIIASNNAVTIYCDPYGNAVYIDQRDSQAIAVVGDNDPCEV